MGTEVPNSTNEIKEIAERIRRLPFGILNNINQVLYELTMTDKGNVQMAIRWWFKENGIYTTDMGFFGVSDAFVTNEIAPCDIVIFIKSKKLKQDDLVLFIQSKSDRLIPHFFRVTSVMPSDVEVEATNGNRTTLPQANILGKVLKVMQFNTPGWHEIADNILEKENLLQILDTARTQNSWNERNLREIARRREIIVTQLE